MTRGSRIIFSAVVCSAPFIAAADAHSKPSDALRQFGLIGTWSRNCAIPLATLGGSRVTFGAPADTKAFFATSSSALVLGKSDDISVRAETGSLFEIDDANLLSNNQLKLIGKITKITCSGCRNISPVDSSPRQIIIEMVGAQFHIIDNRLLDGSRIDVESGKLSRTGQPAPLDSKCDD